MIPLLGAHSLNFWILLKLNRRQIAALYIIIGMIFIQLSDDISQNTFLSIVFHKIQINLKAILLTYIIAII